jgi:hypothetical protein
MAKVFDYSEGLTDLTAQAEDRLLIANSREA